MNLIKNNPYRTVGLLVGATAREQTRQINRLKNYLAAEQDPQDDFSFPALGDFHRTLDSIEEAASKLNLDNDKINAALFWFWNGNSITDEAAFEALKSGDIEAANEIWDKLITKTDEEGKKFWKPVTEKNYSAFHNYSVLNIIRSNGNLHNAIVASLYFLESDLVNKFVSSVADETHKTSKKELQLIFLNQLHSDLEANKKASLPKFLEILNKQEFVAKQDFIKGFVQKLIEQIEHKIETAKNKRKASKASAAKAGQELFTSTANDLKQLKSIIGTSDLRYTSISDKVANEILQCGIDHFLHYKDSSTDPGSVSMDLFLKAKTLAFGNIVRQRCQENTENLQEWIDDKPLREKQAKILGDLERLKYLIDEYEGRNETISNAKQLLTSANSYLNNIKSILGNRDDLYLGLSTRIASDAQGMCVSEINKLQERFANTYDHANKLAAILLLKQRVDEAWEVTDTIGSMDLRQDFRNRFNLNKTSLFNLKRQLADINIGGRTGGGGNSSGGNSGCYIATMAYGDYNHPQVIFLRQFRDEVLDKHIYGKLFIKTYYFFSPKLVNVLKGKEIINTIIRKLLNQFIKLIK